MNTLQVKSPYDHHLIKEVTLMDENQIEKSLSVAHNLFMDRSKWLPKYKRIEILEKAAQIMSKRIEELTKIAAEEGGKPYTDSKVEVLRAINGVKLGIEHLGQIKGEEIPLGLTQASVNRLGFTVREPIGVVVSISAFNHPLNLIVHQTIPAIAVGAPVIVKPASTTPLSCINFVNILYEAGLPEEFCQVVICKSNLAEKLVTDKRVNYLSFIGSGEVGWKLRSKLSPGTRCALEHGGVAPVIVEKDADLEKAIPMLTKAGFYHAGQVCVSVQKIFVHSNIFDEFVRKLKLSVESLVVGDPLDPKTEVGPLIVTEEISRLEHWIEDAKNNNGEIICGGKRISDTCFEPTIILDPSDDALVSKEEVFGPVVAVYPFIDKEEAIRKINELEFAFQASVFTKDIDSAFEMVNRINASTVMVNDHTAFRVDWMPFGGRDSSGIGLGGIPYSMHEMTRSKLIVIKSEAFN